jgi:hypothetical protein
MKKNIKTVALFSALSLAAVSCQKTDEFLPINGNEQLAVTSVNTI